MRTEHHRGELIWETAEFEWRSIWNIERECNVVFRWCKGDSDTVHQWVGPLSESTCPRKCANCDRRNYDDYETSVNQQP